MKYVSYNEEKISKLSFGTVQFGLDYGISNKNGKPSQQKANEIIDYLIKNGVNCFDTALAYGDSEKVLGKALPKDAKVYIVSKIKSDIFLSEAKKSILHSMRLLNSKKLFGLLLHDSTLLTIWTNFHNNIVSSLKADNLIEYFGASIYTSEEFDLAINNQSINLIQIPFNLFDQRALKYGWFERAKEANKLLFIRSIFLQGLFFLKEEQLKGNLREASPYLKIVQTTSEKLGLTVAEFALAYVNTVAQNSIILFGSETLQQAKENITNYNNLQTLESKVIKELNNAFGEIPETIINPSKWKYR